MIHHDPKCRSFHFKGAESSYLIGVSEGLDIQLIHWGKALDDAALGEKISAWMAVQAGPLSESHPREFSGFGGGDLRSPAFLLAHADGSRASQFQYQSHEIKPGKPGFPGPQSYVENETEASTLRLALKDPLTSQQLDLFYSFYPSRDILTRRAVLTQGSSAGRLLRLMSASVDLPAGDYFSTSLPGDWARERRLQQAPVQQALLRLESRRGQAHRMSPFVAVSDGGPDEKKGQAWGLSLAYSGNFVIELEGQPDRRLRLNVGLNDFDFQWQMEAGERFVSPECVLAWSGQGLGGLSRRLHRFVRSRICRGPWRDAPRPVLINSWEAHYFDFKHADIVKLAEGARELGADLVVLDDGWFGRRDSDNSSLGDWVDDLRKLPKGVAGLSQEIHAMGLKFGLWFEPEMISPDSELYRAHPDWALAVKGRAVVPSRNQYVIDMSRPEVRDHLIELMSRTVEAARLDYIKWDMNRPLWDAGSTAWPAERQGELCHRFMMGTYDLMERLQKRFPALLVEGCAGGGGRFDYGVLCYHPQIWASDNTDALDRIAIQWGSSYFLPPITMGAHISESPNHFTRRATPLSLRAHVAMGANFGIELAPARLSAQEKAEVAAHVAHYKKIRHVVHEGEFYRLARPPHAAWCFVSQDQKEALLFAFGPLASVTLDGLNGSWKYRVEALNQTRAGASLMQEGLKLGLGDMRSAVYSLEAEPV